MRHHALNDIIARAFASAGVPAMKELLVSLGVMADVRMV